MAQLPLQVTPIPFSQMECQLCRGMVLVVKLGSESSLAYHLTNFLLAYSRRTYASIPTSQFRASAGASNCCQNSL